MTDRIELFERRNRWRSVALVVLATLNYVVAVVMAAIALGIGVAVAIDHSCELAGPAGSPLMHQSVGFRVCPRVSPFERS